MKLSSRLVAPLVATGLLAVAAHAVSPGSTRYEPTTAPEVVAPFDACTPETFEGFSRIAVRSSSKDPGIAKGTLRGAISSPDILFGDIYGSATVELVLVGTVGGSPFSAFSDPIDIQQDRGKWVFRKGTVQAPFQIAPTTVVIRPAKGGDTASLTLKWVADLTTETWAGFDDGSLEFGALITLHEGSTACGDGIETVWDPLVPITP